MLRFTLGDPRGIVCLAGLAAGFVVSSSAVMAQEAPGPPTTQSAPGNAANNAAAPKLSVTTHEVLVDVLVTDSSGHPVTGLTAGDLTVTEEGTPQHLKRMAEHLPMTAADVAKLHAGPALPANTFTNFTPEFNTNASTVILLDALNTPIEAQMVLRQELIKYLKTMQPGNSIAVFQLDTEMRLIQGFTSDQQALIAAADSNRNMPSLKGEFYGRGEAYVRMRRLLLRDGMRMMGRYLAGFPGRKNLIWFTGEVPLTILGHGLGNPFRDGFRVRDEDTGDDDLTDVTDVLTVSRVALYPVDTRGLMADPQFDASRGGSPGHNAGLRFANRQAFDHTNMSLVADATGGKAYYNTNGLSETIAQVVNNGSYFYTLAYSTTNTEWNGQHRKIKIKVDRPDVNVQHREGYYAVNRDQLEQRQLAALKKRKEEAAAKSQEGPEIRDNDESEPPAPEDAGVVIPHTRQGGFAGAMGLGAVAPTELVFAARVSPEANVEKMDKKAPPQGNFMQPDFRGKPFRNYSVVIKADARRFKLTKTSDGIRHGRVEFAAVVYDAEGAKVNSVLSTATIDMPDAKYRAMLAQGAVVTQTIAIPVKGNYFLRLGVHDVGADQVGALEIPVDQIKPETGAH